MHLSIPLSLYIYQYSYLHFDILYYSMPIRPEASWRCAPLPPISLFEPLYKLAVLTGCLEQSQPFGGTTCLIYAACLMRPRLFYASFVASGIIIIRWCRSLFRAIV